MMTDPIHDFWKPGTMADLDRFEKLQRRMMMSPDDWAKGFQNTIIELDPDVSIRCQCGWCGGRKGLVVKHEVEISRRENRHLHYGHPDLVATVAETCPQCGRWLFADEKPLCDKMFDPVVGVYDGEER